MLLFWPVYSMVWNTIEFVTAAQTDYKIYKSAMESAKWRKDVSFYFYYRLRWVWEVKVVG